MNVTGEDVLVINTYGGSLIIGAKLAGANVIGSLEDANFGVAVQRANFPDLEIVPKLPWPELDLTDVWVLAHPPCAAFSQQNVIKGRRGEGTDAFDCHKRVMNYALGANCAGLAIESVCGASAAEATYRQTAAAYGYDVSLVFLNAVSFGVPQWRPRLWVIFRRKFTRVPIAAPTDYKVVGDIIRETGTPAWPGDARVPGVVAKLPPGIMRGEHGPGSLRTLAKYIHPDRIADDVVRELVGGTMFQCKLPRVLDERTAAPVILHDSSWFVRGRLLWQEEYDAIMGFPEDYVWPKPRAASLFLSKGVCPPIVPWILQSMIAGEMLPVNDLRPTKREVWRT